MGKMKDVSLMVAWIGEDAAKARNALSAGDYATVDSCLHAIGRYAAHLGYIPAVPTEGDTEEDTDEPMPGHQ